MSSARKKPNVLRRNPSMKYLKVIIVAKVVWGRYSEKSRIRSRPKKVRVMYSMKKSLLYSTHFMGKWG